MRFLFLNAPVAPYSVREQLVKLLSLFVACFIFSSFVVLSTLVVLSNFCHLLTPCYLLTFYATDAPYKCACCTHHTQNSLSRLLERTPAVPIYLSNSPGVFAQRAILKSGRSKYGLGITLKISKAFFSLLVYPLPLCHPYDKSKF